MFRIIKNGECLGMTEAPNYIKLSDENSYTLCPEPEASGIAFEGTPYHLEGRPELGGLETVSLQKSDAGMELSIARADVETLKADLASADETAIELYEGHLAQEKINAAQDDALIELFESIGG